MKPLRPQEILDLEAYEAVRDAYRQRVLAHKEVRRVGVGDRVSVTFEDRETVRYQIQEMARIERIREPERIAHEIEAYGELVPGERELCATLFIEIPDMARIRPELDRLIGIDECVFLVIGEGPDAMRVQARFDPGQMEAERISAVHYLRFPFGEAEAERFLHAGRGEPIALVIDHPAYRAQAPLLEETRESLRRDLRGEPAELLDARLRALGAQAAARPADTTPDVRVLRAERDGQPLPLPLRIEPRSPLRSLADADPALVRALLEAAVREAQRLAREGLATRIVAEIDPDAEAPARVEVLPAAR